MAFGHFSDDEVHESADINVTPLVDVMLVLLIVFMITMPVLTHSIPLTLPTAANPAQQAEPTSPLHLSIGADGQYKLGDQTLSLVQLQNDLHLKVQANPDVVLAIAADKHVAYDHVAQVLAAARDAGLVKVGFVTEDK
jgi:biopolymer transport protein ExbD